MSTEFEVTGLFYEDAGYKCRKYLDIKRTGSAKNWPDLMVVMMNPGSSFPLNGIDYNSMPSEAEPDTTQYQIMKVMDTISLDFARILNLSDLRTPDSSELYKFLKSEEANRFEHSIFSDRRKEELNHLFIEGVPAIYGWGVSSTLAPLAKKAIESLGVKTPHGMLKKNTKYSYYHPLPRLFEKQIEWVKQVTSQITRTQQNCAGVGSVRSQGFSS